MSDREIKEMYAMEVLNLVNIVEEIRAGRAKQLANDIENSLSEYLTHMKDFKETPLKAITFYAVSLLFKSSKRKVPNKLRRLMTKYQDKAQEELEPDYYELQTICGGGWRCIPKVTSLRPVDLTKKTTMGWRYSKDVLCGLKWPKLKTQCGAPLGLVACQE
jgi:hypothetical protein